jgi:hypothetical protein
MYTLFMGCNLVIVGRLSSTSGVAAGPGGISLELISEVRVAVGRTTQNQKVLSIVWIVSTHI